MKQWLQRWNLPRVLRLVLGVWVLVNGLYTAQWVLAGLGLVFAAMALANKGGCAGSCAAPPPRTSMTKKEITYEEIN